MGILVEAYHKFFVAEGRVYVIVLPLAGTAVEVRQVIGGSQGAQSVNEVVREALDKLLEKYQVVHICGKEKMDNLMLSVPGYKQFEYIKGELKDVFARGTYVGVPARRMVHEQNLNFG